MRAALYAVVLTALFVGVLYGAGKALGIWGELEAPPARGTSDELAGWTVHSARRFSIALPPSWKALRPKEDWDTAEFRRNNPELAEGRNPNSKLVAFDGGSRARTIAGRELFVTNMSVSQARVSLPRAKLWRRELEELRRVPKRVGPVRTWRTEIAGQKALKARLRVRARSVARRRVALSVTQWSVVADGYEYVLSFTTAKAHESAYAATFERSAKSLELVEPRPEPEPAPAANDFAEQAHPICLADVWFPEAGTNVTPTQRARQAAKRVAEKLRELKRLSPPAGSRREYRAMLAAGERLLAAMRRHADATAAGDGSAAGRAVNEAHRAEREGARHARKLGLGGCG